MKTCIKSDIGNIILSYELGQLSEEEMELFEQHLFECEYCANEVFDDITFVEVLKTTIQENVMRTVPGTPLLVTSLYDRKNLNLSDDYFDRQKHERLAAAAGDVGKLAFPVTVEYADGKVVGQFRKRAGQLFFRLVNSTIKQKTYTCLLTFTPPSHPSEKKIFELHEGEDKALGDMNEFVISNTIQGFLETLKQFQLALKSEDEA